MNEHKTFEELERLAYMSNLPKIASLYAQLDDNVKMDSDYHQCNSEALEKKVEALENKLEEIAAIITYD